VFKIFWDDVVVPFIETLEKTAKELGKTVLDLFLNNHSLSVKDAMSKMGIEILLNFVDEVKRLVIGFLKIGKAVISNFQQFISCKVEIPIFSTLYKEFISGGEELTFLDGFSMIIAIPVTIIIKMTTGKAPADLTGFSYGSLVTGDVAAVDAQLLGFNQVCNVTGLIASPLAGVLDTVSLVTSFESIGRAATDSTRNLDQLPHPNSIEMASVPKLFEPLETKLYSTPSFKAASIGSSIKKIEVDYWKDVFAAVNCVVGIPTKPDLPAYDLRQVSWILVCINRVVAAAIRRVENASEFSVKKALAVLQAVLATINYAIVVTIKAKEFKTPEFPGKDNKETLLQIISGTFYLIRAESDSVTHLAYGKFSF